MTYDLRERVVTTLGRVAIMVGNPKDDRNGHLGVGDKMTVTNSSTSRTSKYSLPCSFSAPVNEKENFTCANQLELFTRNLPKRPYAVDQLGDRLLITSPSRALRRRLIQANPPWMRVFAVFDIDRPGAALAWEDTDLPSPLWTAENRENGHAHSAWCLEAPVLLGQHDRQTPMRYLCAVESAMRERLGADPAYGGLITKNPAHGHWRTLWGPEHRYTLAELAEYLPGSRSTSRANRSSWAWAATWIRSTGYATTRIGKSGCGETQATARAFMFVG